MSFILYRNSRFLLFSFFNLCYAVRLLDLLRNEGFVDFRDYFGCLSIQITWVKVDVTP